MKLYREPCVEQEGVVGYINETPPVDSDKLNSERGQCNIVSLTGAVGF